MKDLGKAKTIIRWEITRDIKVGMFKIDQKKYIQDFLEAERMTSCHITIFFIKTRSFIFMNQIGDYDFANFAVYQWLIKKLIYLAYGT